ncbi:hypothetical protein BSK66_25910 [Paenibacillus odorifer]|uniref:Phage capsid-like C-terminal domain-containing protein n=2 Tax=Paenibacillus TaxID=44249 RepID=A0A1R0X157_9BACL|nr:hypothetical protein BJP51_26765 [Paenibacillus odorifer]OME49956.1 hypothetical protein BSK66_25910 [Paenibacillus odorifer]
MGVKMMKNINEMRRDLTVIKKEASAVLEKALSEKRALSPEEEKRFSELEQKIKTEESAIQKEEEWQMSQMDGASSRSNKDKKSPVLKLEQRMSDQVREIAPHDFSFEEREGGKLSLGKMIRGVVTGDWLEAENERRAMSENTMSLGGYAVPLELSAQVIDLSRNKARVFQAGAGTVPMTTNRLTIARVTGDPTAHWVAENEKGIFSDVNFGQLNFQAKKLVALVKMSRELFEDAANIDSIVNNAISQSLALELDRVSLYGSGQGEEPKGLKSTQGVLKISMGANGGVISSYDVFSEATEYIQEQNGEPNAILYAPRTSGAIDRLKDSTGQPLQAPESVKNLQKLVTKQIPTNIKQGTNESASDAFVGDWSKLLVGIRHGLIIELSQEASDGEDSAFTQHQVWIKAVLRADVQIETPEHFNIIEGITKAV